jgi:hypothetical protein
VAHRANATLMAKNKDALRDHCAWLYVTQKLTLTDIKERTGIPLKTLSSWKKGRKGEADWDSRKRLHTSTPVSIKENLLVEMEKITRGEKSNVDGDQLVKFATSIQKIDKQMSVQTITSALMMLEDYLSKEDPAEAVRCLPSHKKFILHLIENDGKV